MNTDDTDAAWDQQEQEEHELSDTLRDIALTRISDKDFDRFMRQGIKEIEDRKKERFWDTYANGAFKETD